MSWGLTRENAIPANRLVLDVWRTQKMMGGKNNKDAMDPIPHKIGQLPMKHDSILFAFYETYCEGWCSRGYKNGGEGK